MKIPARIIQTGKSRNLSPLAKAAATNLKLLHPDWDYVFFDDEDVRRFIRTEFPQYSAAFDAFPYPIQRFDFFRYLAVLRLGGFYFDLDVFLSESLFELLDHQCVFPFEELTLNRFLRERHGMDWEIGNYAFASTPNHPFLRVVIQNCIKAVQNPGWVQPMLKDIPRLFRADYHVLYTTGPGLVSRTFAENPDIAQDVTILFPEDVCDTRSWHQFGNFGVHMMDGSWRTSGNYLRRRLGNLWEGRAMRRVWAESRRRGRTRTTKEFAKAGEP